MEEFTYFETPMNVTKIQKSKWSPDANYLGHVNEFSDHRKKCNKASTKKEKYTLSWRGNKKVFFQNSGMSNSTLAIFTTYCKM